MTEEPSDLRDREGGEVKDDPEQDPDQEMKQDTEQTPESEDETRRPISVRDLMPSPPSRPSRRPPERAGRPGRGAQEGEEPATQPGKAEKEAASGEVEAAEPDAAEDPSVEPGTAEPGGAASVPTPVRVAMDAPPPGDSRPPDELPSRRFEVDGEDWIVRLSGRTITGTRPDAGALLMHLSFHRPDEPESASRKLITVDRPLDALYEEDLLEFFQRSLPTDTEV